MRFLKNKLTMMAGVAIALMMMGIVALSPSGSVFAKTVQIDAAKYGYGKYVVTAKAMDNDGVYDEDSVVFYYLPVYATIEDDGDGEQYLKLEYDYDDGSGEDDGVGKVERIEITILDENGDEIPGLPSIIVAPPTKEIPLSDYFDEYDLPSGEYQIKVVAYGEDDEVLYKPFDIDAEYDAEENILVPDTGSFSRGLNIMQADYLTTGLIAFAVVAVPGIFIVMRKGDKASRKTKRR